MESIIKINPKIKLVIFIVFILVTGIIASVRSQSGSNDFDTFYQAGKNVLKGESAYYTGEYYQENATVSPFLYPPFAAYVFSGLALFPLKIAAFLWNALNIFLFFITIKIIILILKQGPQKLTETHSSHFFIAICFGAITLLDNLSMAQINILVFFITIFSLFFWLKKYLFISGILLSIAFFYIENQ